MNLFRGARQPFVGLALAAATGILIGEFLPPPRFPMVGGIAITILGGLVLLRWPRLGLTYLLVGWSFLLLHQIRTTDTSSLLLAARLGERSRAIVATGAVVSEPKIAPNGLASFLLKLSSVEVEGKSEESDATILVRWRGTPAFGDEFRLVGSAAPIAPPRNPGEFDMRWYLHRHDIHRALFVRYEEDGTLLRHGGGNPVLRLAQRSRVWLQAALCRGLDDSPEVQNFISGITLGLRHQTPEDIEEPFQQTGTLHLFAVAGLHVGIVAELLWMLAKVARLSRKWAAGLIIPLLLFYAAVTGLHISSVRAAIMGAVLLGASVFERKAFTLNSLAAAAMILLCWSTNELFSTGFQLSFSVVAAIVLLADPLTRFFRRYTAPDPFLPRTLLRGPNRMIDHVFTSVGQGASISIAAWIGSLALLLWYFHLVTPISLLANLVVVPIAFFVLAVALLSILTAPVLPALSIVFNNANWLFAQIVLAIVHLFAQIPGGHYYFAHPPWLGEAVGRIQVLDLGAGAAVHLQNHSADWLFDCGSERDYDRVIREYLHASGVNSLRGLLLSHGDSLHIGAAGKLLSDVRPAIVIDNPAPDRSTIHKRLRRLLQDRGINTRQIVAGDMFPLGTHGSASVLYPPAGFSAPMADDQALVIRVQFQEAPRILFMSDSGNGTETALLSSGVDLRSDILIKGQHHSGESGSEKFLEAVRPRLVIATSRDFPSHERISDDWTDRLRARGIKLFRQDESGAVELRFRPESWEARAYITGEVFRSSNR
ncbi:MAG: competence protein ComEC [Verrucomicrobiota bacterium]